MEGSMGKTYKTVEVVGTSPKGFAEAARNAVEEASKSIKAVRWFRVADLAGRVMDGKASEFQATVKIGFRLLGPEELK
jgi:flavin-binding protein dodecin